MSYSYKKILTLISLTSITFLTNGCVAKNSNGMYTSVYSYDPYVKEQRESIRPTTYRTAYVTPINTFQRTYQEHTQVKPVKRNYAKKLVTLPIVHTRNNYKAQVKPYQLPMVYKRPMPVYKTAHRPKTPLPIASNIEKTAKSLLGTDYQFGANGPYQYDCSSFTQHVFAKQGINLPRVSRDQAQRGQYVSARQLQKGDLIFFDSKKSTKVSHVGIYLGRGNFIHASSAKDKVTISNLSSNYYAKHFKWGRRVTNVNYAMK